MRPIDPRSRSFIVLLAGLTAVSALSIDMSLPAIPDLSRLLDLSAAQAQLTLSLFLAGYGIGQLFVGPASDRFGRRPVLLWGMLAFAIAGLGCALAPGGGALIALRFVQGMAASVGPVLGRAVVRDRFSAAAAAQALSSLVAVFAVAPMVAPVAGAALLARFGWRSIYAALGATGVALFAATAIFLEESLPERDPSALAPRQLARHVAAFFAHPVCRAHALILFFVFAAQFSYISGSPFVIIDVFGVARHVYPYFFAATAACLMLGASLNRRLLARGHAGPRLLRLGLRVIVASGVASAAAAIAGLGLAAVFAPFLVLFVGIGLVGPNATAAALEPMPRAAGVASAVIGASQMAGGAIAGFGVSALYDRTARPMAVAVALLGAAALVLHAALAPRPAAVAPG